MNPIRMFSRQARAIGVPVMSISKNAPISIPIRAVAQAAKTENAPNKTYPKGLFSFSIIKCR